MSESIATEPLPLPPATAATSAAAHRRDLVRGLPGFAGLTENECNDIAAHLLPAIFTTGHIIVTEGETGDRLYIVEAGRVEVSTVGPEGPIVLAVVGAGEAFGELALLGAAHQRQATVTALTEVVAWSLGADAFEQVLALRPGVRATVVAAGETLLIAKFLKQASPFSPLDPPRLRRLAARLRRQPVVAGEVIVRQDDQGDTCYLVRHGHVEVVVRAADGSERQLTTLGPGMLFGEAALLTDGARNATVRSLEAGEVLALRRADLLAAMEHTREVGSQLRALVQLRDRPRQIAGVVTHVRTTADGGTITVLKDPRRGAYFQLSPQGCFVWQRLDGEHSLRDLALDVLLAFKSFSPHAIVDVIGHLAAAGFIEYRALRADVVETAVPPWWQRVVARARQVLTWQAGITGVDAPLDRIFRGGAWWFFSRAGQVVLGALAVAGVAAFAATTGRVAAGPGDWGGAEWWFLAPAYVLAIVAHEAGHALTVKAFGREVPRVGVGWFWFGPVAFVDTSDMWLAGRWPRIAVSLAGPYANLVLAGAAALGAWSISSALVAGVLWQFALVSYIVVLLNLNPLLEYDGYYVLMDWLERPNLRRRSLAWLGENLRPALRHPSLIRGHWVEFGFGLGSLAYIAVGGGLAIAIYGTVIRGWLASD